MGSPCAGGGPREAPAAAPEAPAVAAAEAAEGAGTASRRIGLAVLHAKVTVRDSVIEAPAGGPGGHGGAPEEGGEAWPRRAGRRRARRARACEGGSGGGGGDGGYGGPGRGGDSIGIAYLDEDQLTLEGVTFELGVPGPGGTSWASDGTMMTGEAGVAVETLRFPE